MTPNPPKACVIGQPIAHSRSPLIHGYWLAKYGISGSYTRVEVAPAGLGGFLRTLGSAGFAGCNITIPHKEAALHALDHVSESAKRLGSVNTVYVKDGKTFGDTTDGAGFCASLLSSFPDFTISGAAVLILGAGGSSRAIAGALLDRGVGKLFIANRTLARAEEMRRLMGDQLTCLPEQDIGGIFPRIGLLINTTSRGMNGVNDATLPLHLLPATAIVADIVYTPLKTALITQAEALGLRALPGLGMLLHQAVPGFAGWFGVTPDVTPELHDLVAADIQRQAPS